MILFGEIRQWAYDRNLIKGSDRKAQMLKMTEEVGELAAGIAKSREEEVKDAIGDCVVVLTILAAQSGITIEECIESAYNTIKDRKGYMSNGVFIREEQIQMPLTDKE
jgi:NTP pyrophosphatase (non-canonical NTP hydrolase)